MYASLMNWKTTTAGIVFGILMAYQTVYKPGMSLKEWSIAAAVFLIGALPGILAKDFNVTGGTIPANSEAATRTTLAATLPPPQKP